jgi:hypothetical protein
LTVEKQNLFPVMRFLKKFGSDLQNEL